MTLIVWVSDIRFQRFAEESSPDFQVGHDVGMNVTGGAELVAEIPIRS